MRKPYSYLSAAAMLLLAAAPINAERLLDISVSSALEFSEKFEVLNANNDYYSWKYDAYSYSSPFKYATCHNSSAMEFDDYLTTKQVVHLEPGMAYRLHYNCLKQLNSSSDLATMHIAIGTQADPLTHSVVHTQQDMEWVNRYSSKIYPEYEFLFEVTEAGDYYVSFHADGDAGPSINNITLDEAGNPSAPAPVSDLSAVADANHETKATISFSVPTKTVTGNDLESVSKVEILRNGELATTKTELMPGDEVSWTDENSVRGDVTYAVTVYSGELASMPSEFTVFVGPETPEAVSNLMFAREGNVSKVSWTAPAKGAHGLDIDAESVRYKVERIVNGEAVTIAEAFDGTSYDDSFDSEERVTLAYRVTPFIDDCFGASSTTAELGIGAVSLPFADSFAGASFGTVWTPEAVNGTKTWEAKSNSSSPTTNPQDEDGGFAWYNSYNAYSGNSARLISPEFIAASATNPMLEFYYMGFSSSKKDYFKLQIKKDNGDWEDVENAIWYPKDINKNEWRKAEVPLKAVLGDCSRFAISFTSVSDYGNNMSIDNVHIYNLADHDLAITQISVPETVIAGNNASISVTVRNSGASDVTAEDYTASVIIGGESTDLSSCEIAAGSEAVLQMEFAVDATMATVEPLEVKAVLTYDEDEVTENNTSESSFISYATLDKATVTVIDGTQDENGVISLTWEPAVDSEGFVPADINENFESFAKGYCGEATENPAVFSFGEWTSVKNDNSESNYWFYAVPAGFTVFDSDRTTSSYAPHGSSDSPQILITSGKLATGSLDQWLISPELKPYEPSTFNVEFKMQVTDSYNCMIDVAYSTTDSATESFTTVETLKVNDSGTMYTKNVKVPGTAKYIALHNKSVFEGYGKAIALDDIRITSDMDVVLGYNVYEIGKGRVNDEPVTECSYTFNPSLTMRSSDKALRSFAVSALYDGGESPLGTTVEVIPSSVENLNADRPFALEGDRLVIYGGSADIHSVDGTLIGRVCQGNSAITLDAGIYIITVNGKSYKFAVR